MLTVKEKIGSYTVKGGFENEHDIVVKFNNWQSDLEAQEWLVILGYDFKIISSLNAVQIPSFIKKEKALELGVTEDKITETKKFKKADVQVQIKIQIDEVFYIENLSLKKANRKAAYNQIDKRKVDTYQDIWGFNNEISNILKLFTGEITPAEKWLNAISDKRRVNFKEMPEQDASLVIKFFSDNKYKIINDIIQGRGALKADWLLVTCKEEDSTLSWALKNAVEVCNYYSMGEVKISPKGSLTIGKITMQRKGGTPDPTSLQFKFNPLELFKV